MHIVLERSSHTESERSTTAIAIWFLSNENRIPNGSELMYCRSIGIASLYMVNDIHFNNKVSAQNNFISVGMLYFSTAKD